MVHLRALIQAVGIRRKIGDGLASSPVLPLRGGSGALLKHSAYRRLVTVVDRADVDAPSGGIAGWLERRQARRSARLVVPDRPTGVAIALKWGLNPERIRLSDDFEVKGAASAAAHEGEVKPWYSGR